MTCFVHSCMLTENMAAASQSKHKLAGNERKSSCGRCCALSLVSVTVLMLLAAGAGAYIFISYDVHSVTDVVGKT